LLTSKRTHLGSDRNCVESIDLFHKYIRVLQRNRINNTYTISSNFKTFTYFKELADAILRLANLKTIGQPNRLDTTQDFHVMV
jgi:hypothetical protein